MSTKKIVASAAALFFALTGSAFADGLAENWQLGLQDAATPTQAMVLDFHNLLLWIIVGITLFVLALLIYVVIRYRAKVNPSPSRTAHHTWLEVAWTITPVAILAVIASQSFPLLYFMDKTEEAELTVKAIGKQWYWTYEYPADTAPNADAAAFQAGFSFDSFMVRDEAGNPAGNPRLLAVDNELVLPVGTNIRVLVTADDVIHSWAVPAFGVKKDGVPGRTNETWVRIEKPGMYYGQCSEICGDQHGYMPIAVRAVSKEEFAAWYANAGAQASAADGSDLIQLAQRAR